MSRISPSPAHLLQSVSFSAWVSVTLCSDQDRLQHLSRLWLGSRCLLMIPVLSRFCHSTAVFCLPWRVSPSRPPPSSARLPILMLSLLLLLPTPSFSIHILEDIYEHETEHVCICTILSAEETYIFSSSLALSPSSSLSSLYRFWFWFRVAHLFLD